MTIEILAEARRNFQEADTAYQAAKAKARSIADRIQVAKAKLAGITNRRVTGTDAPEDAAEFGLLSADIELLTQMLAEAEAQADAKSPEHQRNLLMQAETLHQRELDQAKFEALSQTAQKLEAALCNCIGQTHAYGKRLGHFSLSQSWRPSDTLHRAINHGVPPGGTL